MSLIYVFTRNSLLVSENLVTLPIRAWTQSSGVLTCSSRPLLKSCPFPHRGLECKSRKSRDTWDNRKVCPWSTKWSRAKANRVLLTKVCIVKAMVFPVVMHACENWTIKKAEHWRTDAFEMWGSRRLKSPLDCKEIQPVHTKGNQSWIFIGRTDVEAGTPK